MTRLPVYFIPHGAGPCFFMDWQPAGLWDPMAHWLRHLADKLPEQPKALLVISAHWEATQPTINGAHHSGLLFDYGGFPAHTYQLTWPALGSPTVADRVSELLFQADIAPLRDDQRGLDHGVFIPLKLTFPHADIPVVQLSLLRSLSPAAHIAMGKALQPLRDEGVLIIGSGMSYHNMQHLQRPGEAVDPTSEQFDVWLRATLSMPHQQALAFHTRAKSIYYLCMLWWARRGQMPAWANSEMSYWAVCSRGSSLVPFLIMTEAHPLFAPRSMTMA